jgi:hypothetical protein
MLSVTERRSVLHMMTAERCSRRMRQSVGDEFFRPRKVFFGYYNRPAVSRFRSTLTLGCDRVNTARSRAIGKFVTLFPCCLEINYPAGFLSVLPITDVKIAA